jgi:glucokinase
MSTRDGVTAVPADASASDGMVVLGLDFGGTKIAVSLCDTTGRRLGSATVDSRADDGAKAGMDRGIDAARALLAAAAPGRTLGAVGACTFGIPGDDGVALAPNIPGWHGLPFGRELREAFPGVPVRMATDVKAAAQAELRWGSLRGCDPALYLNLGTGLAIALIVGGTVVAGGRGAAGEIGYNLRDVRDVGAPLSGRVPLEEAVSGKALAGMARSFYGRPVSAAEVFDLAADDPGAADLVDAFVRELALHLVNLSVALDPVRIAVGGGMVRSWDRIAPGLRAALDAGVPFPPELVLAQFPFDAPLIGALALGVEAAAAAAPSSPTRPREVLA